MCIRDSRSLSAFDDREPRDPAAAPPDETAALNEQQRRGPEAQEVLDGHAVGGQLEGVRPAAGVDLSLIHI